MSFDNIYKRIYKTLLANTVKCILAISEWAVLSHQPCKAGNSAFNINSEGFSFICDIHRYNYSLIDYGGLLPIFANKLD